MALLKVRADVERFRALLECIKPVSGEATIMWRKEGLEVNALDQTMISYVGIIQPPDAFDEYVCEQDIDTTINVDDVLKLIKTAKKGEPLELETEDPSQLTVRIGERVIRELTIRLLQPYDERYKRRFRLGDRMHVFVRVDTDDFHRALKELASVSDQVVFKASENGIELLAEGELGSLRISFEEGRGAFEVQRREEFTPFEVGFALRYILDVVKSAKKVAADLSIGLAPEHPIELKFLVDRGELIYYVAPRA
ncbi:hypothetical protein DRN94_002335 [archaeon]|nr:hypothetical protein [archaeon]